MLLISTYSWYHFMDQPECCRMPLHSDSRIRIMIVMLNFTYLFRLFPIQILSLHAMTVQRPWKQLRCLPPVLPTLHSGSIRPCWATWACCVARALKTHGRAEQLVRGAPQQMQRQTCGANSQPAACQLLSANVACFIVPFVMCKIAHSRLLCGMSYLTTT